MNAPSVKWEMSYEQIMSRPIAKEFFMAGEPQKTYDDYRIVITAVDITPSEYLRVLSWADKLNGQTN